MIDASTVDWVRLSEFASRLTLPAQGLACVVRGVPDGDGTWGQAGKAATYYEIEMALDHPTRAQFTRTFLHECGHVARGHCTTPIHGEGKISQRAIQYVTDAKFRGMLQARVDLIEREANEFADLAQATFEREFGAAWVDWPFVG